MESPPPPPRELGEAHRRFVTLVDGLRPELHRYCARMTGSIVDGEDIVQDTLAKAYYQLSMSPEMPPLRPWLFRVAHNAAVDFLRKHDRARVDLVAEPPEPPNAAVGPDDDEAVDPDTVRTALRAFLALPPLQRSAVILKDVLGCTSSEIAERLDTTVPAVKAALVRGRAGLCKARERVSAESDEERRPGAFPPIDAETLDTLDRYVAYFNAGDWDGLRTLLAEEVELDLVSRSSRKRKAVGMYFGQYAKLDGLRLARGTLEGRPVLFVVARGDGADADPRLLYPVELGVRDGSVVLVRDYRYAPYLLDDLALTAHEMQDRPHPSPGLDRVRIRRNEP